MVEIWFAIAFAMLATYIVLDGFDFGAGALHLIVAKNDQERRQVLAAIGPFWDANEVWLLATGGVLLLAFPPVLASGLSGFYFAIFLVLWTLILRGISIEFRSHVDHPLWRSAWDGVFGVASAVLPVLFGAALGNLVRGLPIDADGWFSLALFTDFTSRAPVGILDWYTVSAGVFALVALAGHGATFLAWKTDGPVRDRSHRAATWLYAATAVLWLPLTAATSLVNAAMLAALPHRPLALAVPAARHRRTRDGRRRVARESPSSGLPGIVRLPDRHADGHRRLRVSGDAPLDHERRVVAYGLQLQRSRRDACGLHCDGGRSACRWRCSTSTCSSDCIAARSSPQAQAKGTDH